MISFGFSILKKELLTTTNRTAANFKFVFQKLWMKKKLCFFLSICTIKCRIHTGTYFICTVNAVIKIKCFFFSCVLVFCIFMIEIYQWTHTITLSAWIACHRMHMDSYFACATSWHEWMENRKRMVNLYIWKKNSLEDFELKMNLC